MSAAYGTCDGCGAVLLTGRDAYGPPGVNWCFDCWSVMTSGGGEADHSDAAVCPSCKGRGQVRCWRCHGRGVAECLECGNSETCIECSGTGGPVCPECNGTGAQTAQAAGR